MPFREDLIAMPLLSLCGVCGESLTPVALMPPARKGEGEE
jgi:hypothetical protein